MSRTSHTHGVTVSLVPSINPCMIRTSLSMMLYTYQLCQQYISIGCSAMFRLDCRLFWAEPDTDVGQFNSCMHGIGNQHHHAQVSTLTSRMLVASARLLMTGPSTKVGQMVINSNLCFLLASHASLSAATCTTDNLQCHLQVGMLALKGRLTCTQHNRVRVPDRNPKLWLHIDVMFALRGIRTLLCCPSLAQMSGSCSCMIVFEDTSVCSRL